MPILVLARHATAEPYAATDVDRELSPHGLVQAAQAGTRIAASWPIDTAISSSAVRTVQTGQALVEAVNGASAGTPGHADSLELRTDDSLYGGGIIDWIDVIHSIPADSVGAYIVGHQPTVAEVVGHLCPAHGTPVHFRPSSIAVFDLPGWELAPGDYPLPEISWFPGD